MSTRNVLIAIFLLIAVGISLKVGSTSDDARTSSEETEQLSERVAELEAKVGTLRSQDKRPVRRERARGSNSRAEELDAMLARKVAAAARAQGLVDEDGETDPEVREQLGKIIREEMATAREEAIERRMERRSERREAMVEEFVARQSLDEEQSARLTEVMFKEQDQIVDLFRLAREDGTWNEARGEANKIREASNEALSEILDQDQMAAWRETREENRPHGSTRRTRPTP